MIIGGHYVSEKPEIIHAMNLFHWERDNRRGTVTKLDYCSCMLIQKINIKQLVAIESTCVDLIVYYKYNEYKHY